jgi:hypothetical protein
MRARALALWQQRVAPAICLGSSVWGLLSAWAAACGACCLPGQQRVGPAVCLGSSVWGLLSAWAALPVRCRLPERHQSYLHLTTSMAGMHAWAVS